MGNRRTLATLFLTMLSAFPVKADFQWTAANWTATPSTNTYSDPTATASVTVGPTDGDMLTAHLVATAGSSSTSHMADAYLTFSRTFTIIADAPGQPVSVHFHRIVNGNIYLAPVPSNVAARYTLSSPVSNFNDNYYPILSGPFNLDNIQTLSLNAGDYTFSGQFDVGSVRFSGPAEISDFTVSIGVVPEPQSLLFVGSIIAAIVAFIRSKSRT